MAASILAFIAGTLIVHFGSTLSDSLWIYAGMAAIFFVLRAGKVACFLLGFIWASLISWSVLNDRLSADIEGKDVVIEGLVEGLPQHYGNRVLFNFKPEPIESSRGNLVPARIRLTWYYPSTKIRADQKWRFSVRLKRPHGSLNPGGFDYERWLFLKRIGASGYVRNADTAVLLNAENHSVTVHVIRQELDTKLSEVFPGSSLVGLIKALSIGSRSEITAEQWRVLRRTGTAHLVAISGLHIGLVAGLSFLLLRWLYAFLSIKVYSPSCLAAITALICASAYAALAGFSIPTQRAMIMVTVAMGGIIFQRYFKPLRVLLVALFLVILYDPLAVLSEGFWLSFCAVLLIIFALSGRLGNSGYWIGLLKVHGITAFGLAPVLLLFFQKASVIAPVANLIAVPIVSFVVVPVLLLALVCLLCLPDLAYLLLKFTEQVLGVLWDWLTLLSELELVQWVNVQPPVWTVVLAMFAMMLIFSPKGIPGRRLAVVLVLPLIFVIKPRPNEKDVWLGLLDVGQGLSVVVQTAQHFLVYDAGARFSDRFDMGSSVVAPYLRAVGANKIDALVISHGDNDHIGGAHSLAEEFRIDRFYTSVPEKIDWYESRRCRAGDGWNWDGVEFRFLAPFDGIDLKENDMSCVLHILADGGNVLIPGDIERAAEGLLARRYGETLFSDVLIVPHHGSNSSSTLGFLAAVKPKYALIPAGYRNRFGFPKAEVLERLNSFDVKIANTANGGAIRVEIDAEKGVQEPELYRLTSGRYWNH